MNKKNFLQAALQSVVSTLGVFLFHYVFPSMLNNFQFAQNLLSYSERISHDYLQFVYDYHTTFVAFAVRPITSFLLEMVHSIFHLSYGNSFILVNFFFLWLVGILIYRLSRQWKYEHREALLSMGFFFMSFTVLFSFFSPIYSYDEPIQYLAFLLALFFWVKKKWVAFVLCMVLALIARETTIFFLPALFLFPLHLESKKFYKTNFFRCIILGLPVLLYFIFHKFFVHLKGLDTILGGYNAERFEHFFFNFQNFQYGIESIIVLFTVLAIPLVMIFLFKKQIAQNMFEKNLVRAFMITALINTTIVLLTARAREARLFALPLLFLWPLFGKYLLLFCSEVKRFYTSRKWWMTGGLILLFIFIASTVAVQYIPTAGGNFDRGYQVYFALTLFTTLLGMMMALRRRSG